MDETNSTSGQPASESTAPQAEHVGASQQESHEDPEVQAAHSRMCQAREALRQAEQQYQELRRRVTEKVREHAPQVRDIVKDGLEMVRKHPALGVSIAALLGFFIGRLFRR